MSRLKEALDAKGVTSKPRLDRNGKQWGGASFSRGALYWLLQNRYYLGEVTHAGKAYPGLHQAIIAKELWEKVQQRIESNKQASQQRTKVHHLSLLAGMVYLQDGTRLTPSHTNKNGKWYRYYATGHPKVDETVSTKTKKSVPAHDLEALVEREWKALLISNELHERLVQDQGADIGAKGRLRALAETWDTLPIVDKMQRLQEAGAHVRIGEDKITLAAHPEGIVQRELHPLNSIAKKKHTKPITRTVRAILYSSPRGEKKIVSPEHQTTESEMELQREQLLRRVALGRAWASELIKGKVASTKELAHREKKSESFIYDVLRAGCLAPRVVQDVIAGSEALLALKNLLAPLPFSWTRHPGTERSDNSRAASNQSLT